MDLVQKGNRDGLHQGTQLQPSHLWLLIKASKRLNSTLDFEELLSLTVSLTTELMGVEACSLLLLDKRGEELSFHIHFNQRVREKETVRWGEGIAGWVAREGKGRIINHPEEDPLFLPEKEGKLSHPVLFVPLWGRERVIGVLEAIRPLGDRSFTEEDLALFSAFAEQVGIAVENSRLYNQARREVLEKSTLYEIGKKISSSLDLNEVLDSIIDSLRKVVDYDAAGIYLIDPVDQHIKRETTRGYPPAMEAKVRLKVGEGVMGWVAKTGKGEIVPDVSQDSRYVMAKEDTKSEIAAPLISEGKVIGVFNLESEKLNAYDEDDLLLLTTFASQAAVAVENALLHEEVTKKRLLDKDLALARQIQRTFLPKFRPRIPGFDISGINLPSQEVGGDYYDFIWLDEKRLAVVVADVSGKGAAGAMTMATVRSALRVLSRQETNARQLLIDLNQFLLPDLGRRCKRSNRLRSNVSDPAVVG